MPTLEHYLAYGISKAGQWGRSRPRWVCRMQNRMRFGIGDLAEVWRDEPTADAFGAVLDILGFSELMRREPKLAHVHMHLFQQEVEKAVRLVGNGNVTAALVSDGAFLVGQNLQDLANVAMMAIYRCFLSTPTILIHGYVDSGDYQLNLPAPGRQSPNSFRIHWAGQGVLGIGLEEMFLPKGAALFLSKRIEHHGLPVASHRLLWGNVHTLDWAADKSRQEQLRTIWHNVNKRCPPELAHIHATKKWLSSAGTRHKIQLGTGP